MGQNNCNPWDRNHDGKMSDEERTFRDYMLMTDFETKNKSGYSDGYKPQSGIENFDSNSVGDHVIVIFTSLFLSVICLFVGFKLATNKWGELFDTLGTLIFLVGIVFAVLTIVFIVELIKIFKR